MKTTDVVVFGGGPAGAAAALTLARAGLRCTVLERRAAPAWKIGETLAPESRQMLQALGVWDDFQRDGHRPSPAIRSAWGRGSLQDKDFIFNPHGPAWQLDRPTFENQLLHAAEAAGTQVCRGISCRVLKRKARGWDIETNGRRFLTRWVVDAAGRSSTLLRQEGARRLVLDKLVAIYVLAPVAANDAADARTYVESTEDGWWYSALLPGGRRIFAFQTDGDLLQGQDWRKPQWLRRRLRRTKHVGLLLSAPRTHFIHAPKLTAAQSTRLEPCAGDGWMAAGDAAQSFDPLSGEGLFHALYSGHCAALALQNELAGQSGARQEYVALLASLWERFVIQRRLIYSSETRWPEELFWQRRKLR